VRHGSNDQRAVLTGRVPTGTHLSGHPTNQELAARTPGMLLIFSVLRAHIVPYLMMICILSLTDSTGDSEDTSGPQGSKETRNGTVVN
jgi:hypothetical protein